MNEDVIATSGSLAISKETLRAFAKGQLDEATEQLVLALLDTRPDLAAQVAAISSDSMLEKMKSQGQPSAPISLASRLTSANQAQPDAKSAKDPLSTPLELAELTDFKILKEIGRGGMGVVYLAEHLLTGRKEVLKVLNERLMTNPEARKRFDQEIKCIAAMNHETIVRCYTVQKLPNAIVLCMEHVPGTNLHQFIHSNGPLPIHVACGIAAEVCRGLQHAMDNGLVHRDIKPSNIMLYKADGKIRAKILDFGLARLNTREKAKGLTDDGTLLGTLEYIAPEQCLNAAAADIRSDIYSLGCTLYHMLVGHPPFSGSTGELVLAHTQVLPPTLNLIRPEVPSELAGIIARMLAKSPSRRFSTPREVINDLQPFIHRPKKNKQLFNSSPVELREDLASSPILSMETHIDLPELKPTPLPTPSLPPIPADNQTAQPKTPKLDTTGSNMPSPQSIASPLQSRRFANTKFLGAFISALAILAFLAMGTLLVRTQHATISFENLPKDAQIEINGEVVTAKWDGRQAIVQVHPGTHQVKVSTSGVTVVGDAITLETRENKVITISAQSLPATEPSNVPSTVADHEPSPTSQNAGTAAAVRPAAAVVPFSHKLASKVQQDWASFLNVPVAFTDQRGISFRLIPPGEFLMGSTQSEVDQTISLAFADEEWANYIRSETPQRKVAITKPYYLATTEITQLQFESACSYNPSRYTLAGSEAKRLQNVETANLPVEQLSRLEAVEFCTRLNQYYNLHDPKINPTLERNQIGYRLPTEAEWEFACRAGSDQWFWTGDSPNSIVNFENLDGTIGLPNPVGQSTPNPFGLSDMNGNVREYVADFFTAKIQPAGQSSQLMVDPLVQPTATSPAIIKGGDYYHTPMIGRSASRYAAPAKLPSRYTIGFRVAMSVETYHKIQNVHSPRGVESFIQIHGATTGEFDRWIQDLGNQHVPISVNLRHGAAEHLHDAVAVNNPLGNKFTWSNLADDRAAGADYVKLRADFNPHWKLIYPTLDTPPMLCANAVLWRSKGLARWETRNIGNIAPDPRLRQQIRGGQIPISICVVHSAGQRNTHLKLVHRPGIGNRAFSQLSLEQLESQIALCKKQNWRPSMLQIHAGGEQPLFAAVFRENSASQQWAFSSNLTTKQLEEELIQRDNIGCYPGGLASYTVDGEARYVVIWFEKSIPPIP